MISRVFNALAWVSLIMAIIVFLVSYASYPDDVLVMIDKIGEPQKYLTKNTIFYLNVAFIALFNGVALALIGIVVRTTPTYEYTKIGISLTQIFFNLFFATSVYFINILNSRENFDYSNFGYLIYVSGALLAGAIAFGLISRFILKK